MGDESALCFVNNRPISFNTNSGDFVNKTSRARKFFSFEPFSRFLLTRWE